VSQQLVTMDISQHLPPEVPIHMSHLPESYEDEVDDDIPPLHYARANGLARDHLADSLAFTELAKLQTAVQHDLNDDSELRQFNFGSELKVEERVTISRDGASLLSSIVREEVAEASDSFVLPLLSTRSEIRRARLELPLLKTDHETDCMKFARRDDFEIKLQDIKLPMEMVDEENNEGLVWPSRLSALGSEILEELRQEKIGVSKDAMVHLQATLKHTWTEEDDKELWNSEQKYKRVSSQLVYVAILICCYQNTALEPVTPPLSPLPTPLEPYEPSMSDPAYQLPILSDASSPTKYELEALENKIFEQDVPTPLRRSIATHMPNEPSRETYAGDGTVTLREIYSPLTSPDNDGTPPSIEVQRTKREDLKVEGPLTPEKAVSAPKSVHFSDIVEEMELCSINTPNSPTYENKFFEEAFGDALKTANQQTEQERLIEADSTARVDVPVMDFSKPDPPWKAFKQQRDSASSLFLQKLMIQEIVGSQRPWICTGLVATNMNWVPFPTSLARVALEEDIEDNDCTWEVFVKDPKEDEVIDSSNLTWKPLGLKILKEEDDCDDDEIEPGKFLKDGAQDPPSLIKKRKMELNENGIQDNEVHRLNTFGTNTMSCPLRRNTPKLNDCLPAAQKTHNDQLHAQGFGLLGGTFSAANSIDNYLELRGNKKPKLMDSSYFQLSPREDESAPKSQAPQANPKTQTTIQLRVRKSPVTKNDPLPTPIVKSAGIKTNLIVSSTMLKHRILIKHLEALLPGLVLVERDFSAHNTTTWMPGSVTRSPIKSPLDSEADVIVSPSTGIVITTLQKIKQKPLPGQKAKPAAQERLEQVSFRYEKLAVYVTEAKVDETTNGLDGSDCLAFSSFVGFASGLDSSITVQFVGGGEETLSKWLASTIAQNRVDVASDLLEEETHWELFLRRAGMNAVAAQAIVADLNAPDGVDPLSPTKAGLFGLAAFIDMTVEQRIARFGPLCGRRLLERVSAMIDAKWNI
jgi:hypothetical protein